MAIVVFGSINIDLVAYSEALPRPGETLHGSSYAIGLGGKGCNQAAAVAALNGDVRLVGRIGTDDFGRTATTLLKENNVPTEYIAIDNAINTGLAIIGVDRDGQNCITVIGGANMAIDEQDVHSNQSLFEKAEFLLLQMEIPLSAAMQAADLVHSTGGKVIFDPAPAPKDGLPADVLERIDIITPNETETELLTGIYPSDETEAVRAAQILLDKGVQVVLVKMGARGVCLCSKDKNLYIPPFQVTPIDTVAAGDCFNGGLAYALSQGQAIEDAVRFASACGALSTTKAGASSSAPTLDEVEHLLQASS